MIRLGLCCQFRDQPIKFGNTTASALARIPRTEGLLKLARLCRANAESLLAALEFCHANGIGCFRVISQVLPLKTHPTQGYTMADLPDGESIVERFRACGRYAQEKRVRTAFHPDQFVVLNSTRADVVRSSVAELEYQAEVAEWVGADVVNIHGGGAFGDKNKALAAFRTNLGLLSDRVRERLTLENDDKIFTVEDLLPLCKAEGIPLVYDVHHHRCNADRLSIEQATEDAVATWRGEPLFHLSSPDGGWSAAKPERHGEFIDVNDFPPCWRSRTLTLEVEARGKEAAVLKLKGDLDQLEGRSSR